MSTEEMSEPVAWMVYTLDGKSVCVTDNPADFTDQHKALPLYTDPPAVAEPHKRKPLTDEALMALLPGAVRLPLGLKYFARAIEREHGIE